MVYHNFKHQPASAKVYCKLAHLTKSMSTSSLVRSAKVPWKKKTFNDVFKVYKTTTPHQTTRHCLHSVPEIPTPLIQRFNFLFKEHKSAMTLWFSISFCLFMPIQLVKYVCKEEVPLTDRKRFMTKVGLTDSNEIKNVEQKHEPNLLPEDSKECKRLKRILLKVLRANPEINEKKSFENWEINVVKDRDTKNIPLLSNGRKYVNQGFLEKRSTQEVATMLSREAAEHVLSHKAEKRSFRRKQYANALWPAPVFIYGIGALGSTVLGATSLVAYGFGCAVYAGGFYFIGSYLENRHEETLENEARTVGAMFVANAGITNKVGTKKAESLSLTIKTDASERTNTAEPTSGINKAEPSAEPKTGETIAATKKANTFFPRFP